MVCWEDPEERVVAIPFEKYLARTPWIVVSDIKRILGCSDIAQIRQWAHFWPFQVRDANGKLEIHLSFSNQERKFTPHELSLAPFYRMLGISLLRVAVPI
jgi:hypothetical protein